MQNEVKYEFIKNGVDDWTLKYKDKEIKFHSDVETVTKLQEVPKIARREMIKELAKDGMTIQDLIVTKEVGSKTTEDMSNVDYYEKDFINKSYTKIFQETCKKLFNMSYEQLISDIGIETEDEAKKLGEDIGKAVRGETPR